MNRILPIALCIFICSSCVGASSVNELKNNPGYSKSVKSKYGYQESLKIVKDEHAALLGYDLSCTIFPDMKMGECTFTGVNGIAQVISAKYIDESSALVEFYIASPIGFGERNVNHIAAKLQ